MDKKRFKIQSRMGSRCLCSKQVCIASAREKLKDLMFFLSGKQEGKVMVEQKR